MMLDLEALISEVTDYLESINVGEDGEHLHTNYQEVVAITVRLQQIHNDIVREEIYGNADAALKKFRTALLDPTIERLDKVAAFESRKITSRQIEFEMEKR
jgi:hypothetical protein